MQHSKPRYPLAEAFKLLSLGRSKGYIRIREGRLNVTRDGDTPYITAEEIDRYAAATQPKADYTPCEPRPKAERPIRGRPRSTQRKRRGHRQQQTAA